MVQTMAVAKGDTSRLLLLAAMEVWYLDSCALCCPNVKITCATAQERQDEIG
jgi:hypothetical protein